MDYIFHEINISIAKKSLETFIKVLKNYKNNNERK